ncbi:hypothetical protein F5X99DRAFT_418859 [Biscogniauxia marginata]|nr:hypothetical protein F5X99DRAFT_418859 [Biscogniauxia marginata]
MDQFRKRSLVHLLSRQNSDRGAEEAVTSSLDLPTISSNIALFDISETEDGRGPLGLTTVYEPPECEPIADIIFIHGLGGGSRKTWSNTSNPLYFWPRSWLSEDPDFCGVRIHTYGYKADWGERRQSILNIHDFAQSLLGELKNNPSIRRDNTQLILVGHSMGGCVAKKAYILARQDVNCREIASRIFSIFFLGTPHRGSDLAVILQNMLQVAWGAKPFVGDLLPNSVTLAEINDTFRHYAGDLRLWSFYETIPVKVKFLNKLVVEKYSATLGYSNEEISAVDADHRHVCKFDSSVTNLPVLDPNYRKLRNALCTAIDMIRSGSRVEAVLGLTDTTYEDDLASLQELRHPGSCAWFTEQPHFDSWRHANAETPAILWLTGRPATGKSVLCSHVIDHLRSQNVPCSYFFFKHRKSGRSTLVDCLREIAYQMALQDRAVLQRILQFDTDGDTWDRHDERGIWRKLYLQGLLKLDTVSNHIWVIDGFDECSRFSNWFKLLPNLPDGLRVFITSRSLDEIERGVGSLGPRVRLCSLSTSDTVDDMRAYLTSRINELSLGNTDELCQRILTKSRGSFLWVRLVLKEFENAYTDEDIEAILNEVPEDLYRLYLKMLESIENEKRRKKVAKSILSWVALACRPLTVDELRCAVKLDIQETPHNMEKAILAVCGQLVFIDQAQNVHMIHETAREFLLSEDLGSALAVRRSDRHGHLALLCCKYLSGEVLKAPQGFKPMRATKSFSAPDAALVDYASRFFSEHLYRSNSKDDAPMYELIIFLKNSVLNWLEKISHGGDLSPITRTAVNLAGYLRRRAKYVPPVDENMQIVDAWATDLVRVSAKFRSKLLTCPSSIHCLIPPLCPLESIISKTFTSPTRSLIVRGSIDSDWDDCLVRIDFQKGQTTVLTYGGPLFAVGLSSGQISVYDTGSLQHVSRLQHPERVRLLEFSRNDEYLASGGQKHICVWHPKTGSSIYTWLLESPPLTMCFTTSDILAHIDRANRLIMSNIETRENLIIPWDSGAVISSDLGVFAVGYRNHPILIFDSETAAFLGQCTSIKSNGIDAMAFNPNPDLSALVVSNVDGELLMFDPRTTNLKFQKPNVLVTGNSRGVIEAYEFGGYNGGSLTLIYRLNASDEGIRSVAFSYDSLRIIDCQGSQAHAEVDSHSDTVGALDSQLNADITTLACHSDGIHILCGKANGEQQDVLYTVLVESHNLIVTADESGRILIVRITVLSPRWSQPEVVADRSTENDRLLLIGKETKSPVQQGLRTVINHPIVPGALFKWGLHLQRSNNIAVSDSHFHGICSNDTTIVEAIKTAGHGGTRLHCWSPKSFQATCDLPIAATSFELLTPRLRNVIAVVGSTLIFLDIDLWICSLDLSTFNNAPYAKRHFFILSEWLNVNGEMLCAFTSRNDFVFVNKNGIVLINRGLEFSEIITLSPQNSWEVQAGSMYRRTSSSRFYFVVPALGILNIGGLPCF